MRIYTIEADNKLEIAVSLKDDMQVYRLKDLGMDYTDMNDFIKEVTPSKMKSIREQIESGLNMMRFSLEDVKVCAPIIYPRQDVICLGINYDEHAKEADRFSKENFGGERPYTIYFSKRVNKAIGYGDTIPAYTDLVDSLDYEVELGVVIGKDIKNVTKEQALESIFGYTIINDISARNLQTRHKQWYVGKSLDGFTPMGPCILTTDEIEDVQNLKISCFVNGEKRQESNTANMIQSVCGAIAELSQGMTLQAGTIIATGTPAGVGMGMTPPTFLKPGDEIVCEIEKIGRLINIVGE